jgi:hypothetical protein
MTSLENPSAAAPKPVRACAGRAFTAAALVLINGCIGYAGGYAQRDIAAGAELKQEKLRSVERLREAFNCDSEAPSPRCFWLDYERYQIRSGYTIAGTPG